MYFLFGNADLSKLKSRSGQPLISQEPIYETNLVFPPLVEQEKIR